MKILFVNEQYPLLEDSGANQRSMLFARYLKKLGDVDLVYSNGFREDHPENNIFRKIIYLSQLRRENPQGIREIARLHAKRLPWCIRIRNFPTYKKQIFNLIERENYDIIFVRYLFNAQYFLDLPGKFKERLVLDIDDVLSGHLYATTFSVTTKYPPKRWLDYYFLLHYERRCQAEFRKILLCTERDLAKISKKNIPKTHIIPNIVNAGPLESYNFSEGFKKDHTLLFVGTLAYKPNVIGLQWFLDEIFEPWREKYPGARLLVVGKSPWDRVKQMCNREGVELHADVPDVRPYYDQSRAVVVPLHTGGGTRIKILEAALTNRPVLSTSIGADGLGVKDGDHILIFEDTSSFLKKYEALNNQDLYQAIMTHAREKTLNTYSESVFNKKLDAVFSGWIDK